MEKRQYEYTGFVYIWYDRKRKLFYIGSHMGNLEDGYIGSNTRLQRSYKKRPEDFKRRILYFHLSTISKELLLKEQEFLDRIKHEELHLKENIQNNTTRYYNIKPTASGLSGKVASKLKKEWWDSDASNEWRIKLSENMKINNPSQIASRSEEGWVSWNTGIKAPQISKAKKGIPSTMSKEKYAELCKINWANGCYDNRPKPTEEQKKKISESSRALNRKQTDYQKQRASETMLGKPKTKEHKEKLSIIAKERIEEIVTCPFCGFIGKKTPNMYRWHMTNCKYNYIVL